MANGSEVKRELRARVRSERSKLDEDQLSATRAGLTTQLRALVLDQGARSLSCFLPVRSEPDTRGFLEWAKTAGIEVLLPASRADGLLDWIRPSGEGTALGAFGIDEPIGERLEPSVSEHVDLMLIPAAAIDLRGNRLGWGRGYFDRNLSAMTGRPPVFAVVYEHELLDSVPTDPHDVPVAGVVTPERIIRFGTEPQPASAENPEKP